MAKKRVPLLYLGEEVGYAEVDEEALEVQGYATNEKFVEVMNANGHDYCYSIGVHDADQSVYEAVYIPAADIPKEAELWSTNPATLDKAVTDGQ